MKIVTTCQSYSRGKGSWLGGADGRGGLTKRFDEEEL